MLVSRAAQKIRLMLYIDLRNHQEDRANTKFIFTPNK